MYLAETSLEAFELYLKFLTNSDPVAFTASEMDLAVVEYLRKKGLRKGEFVSVPYDLEAIGGEQDYGGKFQPTPDDYADKALPEFDDVRYKVYENKPITAEEKVIEQAYLALWKREKAKPQTFQSLWDAYLKAKNIDINSRDGKRTQKYWDRWLSISGDQILSENALNMIHDCLDQYVIEREHDGVKGSTIERQLGPVLSCLRSSSRKYRFGWVIEKPEIKKEPPKSKVVLSHQEQRDLVRYCNQSTGREVEVASCILMMIQGGMMPSEVARLTQDRINLNSLIPHIVIDGKAKTKSRRRVIPIVFSKEIIEKGLSKTLKWLTRTTDTNQSKRIQTLMMKSTGNTKVSGHCLRHTFRANCEANGASMSSAAVIAGWSGSGIGLSDELLSYGSEGLSSSEVVKGLRDTSLLIHRHLLGD